MLAKEGWADIRGRRSRGNGSLDGNVVRQPGDVVGRDGRVHWRMVNVLEREVNQWFGKSMGGVLEAYRLRGVVDLEEEACRRLDLAISRMKRRHNIPWRSSGMSRSKMVVTAVLREEVERQHIAYLRK